MLLKEGKWIAVVIYELLWAFKELALQIIECVTLAEVGLSNKDIHKTIACFQMHKNCMIYV